MLRENAEAAYRRPAGALDASRWEPLGMAAHYASAAESLRAGARSASSRLHDRRRQRNQLRSALWAFAAVPWVPDLSLDSRGASRSVA